MPSDHKILFLDDEQELLSSYGDLLHQIPSHPEVRICSSGAHALALLDSERFTLMICDLKLPQMDGLQVISIARRKYPDLRIVVLTSVTDETYRARAYAMGAELFWQKPITCEEIRLFQDCIEALLNQQAGGGFRGMQSKSLVDIIQFECMSRSSSMLRIFHGMQEGTIWLDNGDVTDAQTADLTGEEAFREIFAWHSGNFEMLPADPSHERRIQCSYQGLLLDASQALDESQRQFESDALSGTPSELSAISKLARFSGVEFIVTIEPDKKHESWGLENADAVLEWARETQNSFFELSGTLNAGEMTQIQGSGPQRHIAMSARAEKLLCVGFQKTLSPREVYKLMRGVFEKWIS